MNEEIYEVEKLTILNCSNIKFIKNDSGFLALEYGKQKYEKINLIRLIPFFSKTTYISVSYEDEEKNFKEVGVIEDIGKLLNEQRKIVEDYLEFKYYMPKITKVYSIRDNNRGYIFVKVDTTSGQKTLSIRDWYSNFKMLNDNMLYIVDADGNKYFAPDIYELDKKSLQCVEMFV